MRRDKGGRGGDEQGNGVGWGGERAGGDKGREGRSSTSTNRTQAVLTWEDYNVLLNTPRATFKGNPGLHGAHLLRFLCAHTEVLGSTGPVKHGLQHIQLRLEGVKLPAMTHRHMNHPQLHRLSIMYMHINFGQLAKLYSKICI